MGIGGDGDFTGVTWGDYDNDGRGDVFLSTPDGGSRLYHNDGPTADGGWHFSDVSTAAGLPTPLRGRTTWFFDYDNDGFEDLFVSAGEAITLRDSIDDYLSRQAHPPHLFHNNHDGTFTDVATAVGLGHTMKVMGANFGDLDNDGWLDMYLGTGATDFGYLIPNRLFSNVGGRQFLDVTTAAGVGHLQKGHGIAFADFDGDGAQDVFAQFGGGFEGDKFWAAVFRNPGSKNGWLRLRLHGTRSNTAAIGARIKVLFHDGETSRTVYRTVNSGGSRGSNPLEQHIGLGQATVVDRIEVHWPASEKTTTMDNVKIDQQLTIVE